MKPLLVIFSLMCAGFILSPAPVRAQSTEAVELLLDIEKLSQLRQILNELYDGYKILSQGYNKVKEITSGNFQLHEVFLDGLYLVSPEVRKYKRVADIISDEASILSEKKRAWDNLTRVRILSPDELATVADVYNNLLGSCLQTLEELTIILTDNTTRMSDDERLGAIDRIYADMKKKLAFLRSFNQQNAISSAQKLKEKIDIQTLENLYNK